MASTIVPSVPTYPRDEKDVIVEGSDRSSQHGSAVDVGVESPLAKRTTRKIDIALVPLLGLMYLLSFLDRTNIATAKLNGFEKDLHMPSNGYNTALWVFYLPFVLLEVPCNLILSSKKIKPSYWLGGIMFLLGVLSMCQGFAHTPGALYACRALMGTVEAGIQPGAALLMGQYYRRHEFAPRFSFFICCALIGNAGSAFLAYAIGHMDGTHGLEGWRWIFILEGILTACFGIVACFLIPGWPEQSHFLNNSERTNLLERLEAERGQERMSMQDVNWIKTIFSAKTWLFTLVYFCCDMSAASTVSFSPTILKQLGYSGSQAQLRAIPIYLGGACIMVLSGFIAGKLNCRSGVIAFGASMAIIGWAIQRAQVQPPAVRYFGLFMVYWGANIQMPNTVAWLHSNTRGRPEKAVGMAILAGFGNSCNFVASNVFITKQAPKYPTAFSTGLGIQLLGLVTCLGFMSFMLIDNRRNSGKAGHTKWYI